MALVMIHEQERCTRFYGEAAANHAAHHQLFTEPYRHRHDEAADAAGCERQLSLEQALELQQRLIIEGYEIELSGAQPSLFQTVFDGVFRKGRIVLLPCEPFLLGGS